MCIVDLIFSSDFLFQGVNRSTLFPKYIDTNEFCLRQTAYIKWTNERQARQMFKNTLRETQEFFKQYFLRLHPKDSFKKDILNVVKENSVGRITGTLQEVTPSKNLGIVINDHPLMNTVYIANDILLTNLRTYSTSNMNHLGCQHLYIHDRMLDTSTASSTDSMLDTIEKSSSPSKRRRRYARTSDDPIINELKTCQKAKLAKCNNELARHKYNSSTWDPKKCVQVDLLIFINNHQMCWDISCFLGLIHIESIVEEANINADIEEVLQLCTVNAESKIYRLIQSHINVKLLSGFNNICLTANYHIFKNVTANSKCLIFNEADYERYSDLPTRASFIINVETKATIFNYISAITEIVSTILCVKSDLKTIICLSKEDEDEEGNDKYHEVDLPISAVIPFHILKFFSQVLMKELLPQNKLSFDNI